MKIKLLIFSDWYTPGFKAGGPIQSISNLVGNLAKHADIYIITRDTDYMDDQPYMQIDSNKWNKFDSSTVFYISNEYINYKSIKQLILDVKPSIIYCNSLYSPYFTLIPILLAKRYKIESVLAVRGMLSEGSLSVKKWKKKTFLFFIKSVNFFRSTIFHATTEDEGLSIKRYFGSSVKVIVVQNFPINRLYPFTTKEKEYNSLNLIFVGRIAKEKNLIFALKTLKRMKANINFRVYGPIYDNSYWMECRNVMGELGENISVKYEGVLPNDKIQEEYLKSHALFLPTTGENFGHTIIEAMNCSCIPIISDKTPWRNLEEKDVGFDIPLSAEDKFVSVIDDLAKKEQKVVNSLAENANNYAREVILNTNLLKEYLKLFGLK